MKYLLLCISACLVLSCNNDSVNTAEENSFDKNLSLRNQESTKEAIKLKNYLALEYEGFFGNTTTRSNGIELNNFLENFNFEEQDVIEDELNGKVFMVKSRQNKNLYLCFYENPDGVFLNFKIVEISTESATNEVHASFKLIDGTEYVSLVRNIETTYFKVDSYNKDVFGDVSTRAHSTGCSAAITAASLPWTIGFGIVNPIAGAVAGLVFWGMSELMCGMVVSNPIDDTIYAPDLILP